MAEADGGDAVDDRRRDVAALLLERGCVHGTGNG
jgi:hypothetical protein